MKSALLLGFIVSMLCLLTTALIHAWWPTVAVQTAIAATSVAVWAVRWARQERARTARLAVLVVTTYQAGGRVINVDLLEPLLEDPTVRRARIDAKAREAAVLAQRYANRDASDF